MGKKALGLLLGLTVLTGTNPINADQGNASKNRTILKSPSNIKQAKSLESKLASLTNEWGGALFEGYQLEEFIELGGTFEYAKNIASLTSPNGNQTFYGWHIIDFLKVGGTFEYAKKMLSITDPKGSQMFHEEGIIKYKEVGGTAEYAENLAKFTDKEGYSIFIEKEIIDLFKAGGTVEDAKRFVTITNKEGNPIFSGRDIVQAKKIGLTLESTEDITLVQNIVSIKNKEGNQIFTGEDIVDFLKAGGTVEDAKRFVTITNKEGNPILNGKDLTVIIKSGRTFEYAKELADFGFNSASICRFSQIGIEVRDVIKFNDTTKPNAVIVATTFDKGDALSNTDAIEFYKKIKENYDIWIRVVSTEQEAYDTIGHMSNIGAKIELLILAGHGGKNMLVLGEKAKTEKTEDEREKYMIDTSDTELAEYLKKLDLNAVIFLWSCLTAQGGKDANNLANFVIKAAAGRKVIASTEPLISKDLDITSVYPLDVRIVSFKDRDRTIIYHDKTYTNK